MRVKYDTARQLSTVNPCLYQLLVNTSVFVKSMDFARRFIILRWIIYVYVYRYKSTIFCKLRGEFHPAFYSIKVSLVLIFR